MSYEVVEKIEARGHGSVRATHKTTFEFTKEKHLTSKGDCILAVGASKSVSELTQEFKKLAMADSTKIFTIIEVGKISEIAVGRGSASLTLSHETDMVARKSAFTCSRTIMIGSNKAAVDFSRKLIGRLRNPDARVSITLVAQA